MSIEKLEMMPNQVAIEKISNPTESGSGDSNGFFKVPEPTNDCGIIKYVCKEAETLGLKPGSKVYFGNKRQEVRLKGDDLLIMELSNVLAVVKV